MFITELMRSCDLMFLRSFPVYNRFYRRCTRKSKVILFYKILRASAHMLCVITLITANICARGNT